MGLSGCGQANDIDKERQWGLVNWQRLAVTMSDWTVSPILMSDVWQRNEGSVGLTGSTKMNGRPPETKEWRKGAMAPSRKSTRPARLAGEHGQAHRGTQGPNAVPRATSGSGRCAEGPKVEIF